MTISELDEYIVVFGPERLTKIVYKSVLGLRYRYYEDFECTQRIPNDIVLFDLPVYEYIGARLNSL